MLLGATDGRASERDEERCASRDRDVGGLEAIERGRGSGLGWPLGEGEGEEVHARLPFQD